jgi:adenylate cyclase
MSEEPGARKLAAILAIDLVGYSALSEEDEAQAVTTVSRLRDALEGAALVHGGRIFNTAGDGFMLEFCSAAGALGAIDELWNAFERASVRIGVHMGDVLATPTGDLLGHSVNIAARLQQIAQPGAVMVSMDVRRAVRGKLQQRLHAAGAIQLDKMSETLDVFTLEVHAVVNDKPRPRKPEPVLAVLPYDNDSDEQEMEFFSDGVADEIISLLLKHSKIKVIGRTSAFQFRGDRKGEAAQALGASHLLDGAVRCTKTALRVNAQLIDAGSGMVLWSERYEGARTDAFALEDEIAGKVAASLRRSLTSTDRAAQTIDPAAHELYLRARQIWLMLSDIEEDQAEILLERCVALAPEFADGWAVLASVRAFLLPRDRDMIGEPQHDAALAAAQRALKLDPECAQAMAALSLLKPAFGEHAEKLRLVNEALKRTPNDSSLHVARAAWLYSVGRMRDAMTALDVASRLDPLGPAVEGLRASLLAAHGDLDTAIEIMQAAWARWPDSAFIWYITWSTLCAARRLDEAEALAAKGVAPKRGVNDRDIAILRNYVALLRVHGDGRREACQHLLAQVAASEGALPLSTVIFAASNGCADQAFDVLHAALDAGRSIRPDNHDAFGMARAQAALQLFAANGGEPLWAHPRFPVLAARLGLAQYWIETKKWPDCAAKTAYDFKAGCREAIAALA